MSPDDFVEGSGVAAVTAEMVSEAQNGLEHLLELDQPLILPADYIAHLQVCHGGIPRRRCFRTESGDIRVVCRFVNLLHSSDLDSPIRPSWRYGDEWDIRLDYALSTF